MSDPNDMRDPVDKAYLEAEAELNDEAARAARRAWVLAAVAAEHAAPLASSLETAAPPAIRRPAWLGSSWPRGGWLAAACVAGLGVILATQVYRPPHPPSAEPQAADAPVAVGLLRPPPAIVLARPPAPSPHAAAPSVALPPPPPIMAHETPPPATAPAPPAPPVHVMQPAPPAPAAMPAFKALVAPPPPPSPPPPASNSTESVVVTAERRAPSAVAGVVGGGPDAAADTQAASPSGLARARASLYAAPPAPESPRFARNSPQPPAPPASAQAARLRAAAGAGQTDAVQALLAQGALVDAPDEEGDTALMKAIKADHPATAALLRRYGASLDRANRAGQSARDLAAAVGDAALDRAIGVER